MKHKDEDNNSLRSPEEMGELLRVTSVPTYLLAAAVILMLGAFIVWGFLGKVSDKAYYSGIVFPAQGTTDITLPNRGMVRTMLVHIGDSVRQGQTVALVSIGESHSFLTSTADGLVISSKTDNEAQRDLRIGMGAQVWPADEKRDEIGYVRGRITQVVRYPADADEVRKTLKSDILARRMLELGDVVYEVRIDLLSSPDDSTRYDWSFGEPVGVSMGIGTRCSVLTETRRRSMFQYLFESARTQTRNLKLKLE